MSRFWPEWSAYRCEEMVAVEGRIKTEMGTYVARIAVPNKLITYNASSHYLQGEIFSLQEQLRAAWEKYQ